MKANNVGIVRIGGSRIGLLQMMLALGVGAAVWTLSGTSVHAAVVLDPGFELDNGSWGEFGNVDILSFNPQSGSNHATFFGDNAANSGGFFQQGILAEVGMTYLFTIFGQFESSWDADTFIALEFYQGDDSTQTGVTQIQITENPGGGYEEFSIMAQAPVGSVYVRPVFRFSNVQNVSGVNEGATFDNATLAAVPEPSTAAYALIATLFMIWIRRNKALKRHFGCPGRQGCV